MVDDEEVLVELAVVDVLFILELMVAIDSPERITGTIYGKEFFLLDSLIPGRAIATA